MVHPLVLLAFCVKLGASCVVVLSVEENRYQPGTHNFTPSRL